MNHVAVHAVIDTSPQISFQGRIRARFTDPSSADSRSEEGFSRVLLQYSSGSSSRNRLFRSRSCHLRSPIGNFQFSASFLPQLLAFDVLFDPSSLTSFGVPFLLFPRGCFAGFARLIVLYKVIIVDIGFRCWMDRPSVMSSFVGWE